MLVLESRARRRRIIDVHKDRDGCNQEAHIVAADNTGHGAEGSRRVRIRAACLAGGSTYHASM